MSRLKRSLVGRLGVTRLAESIDGQTRRVDKIEALLEAVDLLALDITVTKLATWQRVTLHSALMRSLEGVDDVTVSVVLPTRDRTDGLARAIRSVLAQQHRGWQLLVVDDSTTGSAAATVAGFADERIVYVSSGGKGVSVARNAGLTHATGQWVAFVDDDNMLDPGWLHAVAVAARRSPAETVFYGAQLRVAESSSAEGAGEPFLLFDEPIELDRLRQANNVDMGVLAVRRDVPELRFDESLSRFVDWELVIRLAATCRLCPLPVWACVYTTDADRRISQTSDRAEHERFIARVADPTDPVGTPRVG